MFTEMFVKEPAGPGNIGVLLGILEEPSYKLRFTTVKLFATMVGNCPKQIQDCTAFKFLHDAASVSIVFDFTSSAKPHSPSVVVVASAGALVLHYVHRLLWCNVDAARMIVLGKAY